MTGFGAASAPLESGSIRVEISGVNRKQAEISISMPRTWTEFETALRSMASQAVSRGRVQISISKEQGDSPTTELAINRDKLTALQSQLPELQDSLAKDVSISLESLLRLGVLEESQAAEQSLESIWPTVQSCVAEALAQFATMRQEEGDNLKSDLLARIDTIRAYKTALAERSPSIAAHYRESLLKRLEQSGLPLPEDDDRIIKEIALFADRCDVSEEMTRLDSHLDQFCKMCQKDESLGRALDFLCQEIFRELNTTGSKANDAELAQIVVSAKTELEKIREQVQNVE
ncbi:MAG: YicC/YloC family endoribonuclease [Akkermansia sp.]